MKKLICATLISFALSAPVAERAAGARTSRVLKFTGVPQKLAPALKKRFPFVFEREVTLAEIDEVVRFLVRTGHFSSVEVVERDNEAGDGRETAVVASLLRHVQDIKVKGNRAVSSSDVLRILGVSRGQVFERKHLLASAEELRKLYESLGYHNAKVEIDFALPNDTEVVIDASIVEGEPVRVSEIVVESADTTLNASINRLARSLRGRILTDDELLEFQKSASDYLVKNRYLTARLGLPQIAYNPDRTQAKITYAIENPWKFEFEFEGNAYFTEATLIRHIEEEKLAGSSNPAPDVAERIRRQYQDIGYANVEVNYFEKFIESTHRLHLKFSIKEHPRVRIKKIEVTGSISRPESYYSQFIRSSSSDLVGNGYYNRKDIEEGAKKLVIELQNQGYLRAKVQSQRAEYSADKSTVTISLAVDEGPLTQIRQIRLEGVEAFPRAQLLSIMKIKPGAALGLQELEDSIAALKNLYRSEGFLEMKILNEGEQSRIVTYNEGNTQATVDFQIQEGPRVRVGSIALQGNSFTKDYVITRELPFKAGDVLTPEKIEETIFRLQKLNLFSRVNLRMLEEGTNISERTVIIEISEKDPGTFTARIGGTNEREYLTIRGLGGIAYTNILGTGRGATFRVEPKYSMDPRVSYVEHVITATYIEPYIFGDRNRGRVSLVREQQLSEIIVAENRTIIQEANTGGFLLDRDLSRNIRLTYNVYSLSNQRKFDRATYAVEETVNIAKIGPLLEFDFRDDIFNPSRGTYSFLNFEYSDPVLGSSEEATQTVHFTKITGATSHYLRLFGNKNFVWVNQLRGGHVSNISGNRNSGVPAQEAFFLGGRSTIRGFNEGSEYEKIPNRIDLNVKEYKRFRVSSDSYFGLFKTEIWFPIYGSLGGTIFYDGGGVVVNQPGIDIKDLYRDSWGTGIRVITPVGPLNLQIAWKLDRRTITKKSDGTDELESPFQVHLSIGVL